MERESDASRENALERPEGPPMWLPGDDPDEDRAPCFMLMMRLTDEGAAHVEELSYHFEELERMTEGLGGRVRGYFITMGEYDIVTIVRLNDDESAFDLAAQLTRHGWVRTTTARAFSLRRLMEIGKK
jgi:uncharacterized protein with GYD domain